MTRILQPYQELPEGIQYVASTPDHVLWGRLPSREDTCIAAIDAPSADIIIDTVSHEGLLPDQGSDPVQYFGSLGVPREQVLDDAIAIAHSVPRDPEADGPHVVTGPIRVANAHPGDVLAVTIQRLERRVPYGVISTRHGRGVLAHSKDFDGNYSQFCRVEGDAATFALADSQTDSQAQAGTASISFPLKQFLGIIGVTPDSAERPHSVPPAAYGGNIDLNQLTEGATLFLPVQVEGAGLYIGDPHFAQGNGEVSLTALEASLRAHLHIEVIPQAQCKQYIGGCRAPFAYVPAADSYGTLIPMGMHADLDEALQLCVRNAIGLVAGLFGVPERQAYLLLSAAVDFEVTQAVDMVKGAHALIDMSICAQCPRFAEAQQFFQHFADIGTQSSSLFAAIQQYESALMANDIDKLAALFAHDPDGIPVTRADNSGLLVGHQAITAFRSARGGAPQRTLIRRSIRYVGSNAASVVSEFAKQSGGVVTQSQVWQRVSGAWKIVDAHLTYPAPAIDQRIWRVVGNPLVQSESTQFEATQSKSIQSDSTQSESTSSEHNESALAASLSGLSVAVKDLFAVRGYAIGAGNPEFLRTSPVQQQHSVAVQRLLDAGASIAGIAQTDEFAYSLAGANIHYGTPPNPRAVGRISGGSSSGPASAVASGQADIGLGTDTAGSIRIPSAYQGLWGIRTTHNRVSREGVYPLSESFDTVGWMTRDAHTLAQVAAALMPEDDWGSIADGMLLVHCPELDSCVQSDVHNAYTAWLEACQLLDTNTHGVALHNASTHSAALHNTKSDTAHNDVSLTELPFTPQLLDQWLSIFSTVRGYEAWRINGAWVSQHSDALAPEIAARFEHDSRITAEEYEHATQELTAARAWIRQALGSRVLIIPSASSVAPLAHPNPSDADALAAIEQARAQTLRLTSIAGIAGLPAVNIPYHTADLVPCGICLIGPAGSDKALITLADQLDRRVRTSSHTSLQINHS